MYIPREWAETETVLPFRLGFSIQIAGIWSAYLAEVSSARFPRKSACAISTHEAER